MIKDPPPLVYIAGPYLGTTKYHDHRGYFDIDRNIAAARAAAASLVSKGLYFVCPHLNSCHFEVIVPEVPPEHWYALDLRILSHCDAMLVLPGYQNSKGTMKEIMVATGKMPIFFNEPDLIAWSRGENDGHRTANAATDRRDRRTTSPDHC